MIETEEEWQDCEVPAYETTQVEEKKVEEDQEVPQTADLSPKNMIVPPSNVEESGYIGAKMNNP